MPRRRKKGRRRKRGVKNRVMKQRLGMLGWKGSKPYHAWSKTLTTKTLGTGDNPGTTAGAIFILPVNNWNDPTASMGSLVAGTTVKTSNRHPMHHANAIADGYDMVQVLSWSAKIKINWIKADTPAGDFMVGYTFVQDDASEVLLTAGTAGHIERLELLTNPRWTFKRYRAVQGTHEEVVPGKEFLRISVPDVPKYCRTLHLGLVGTAWSRELMSHNIADVAHSAVVPDQPVNTLFCTVVIISESGLAMAVSSVKVLVEITQKVKIMRNKAGVDDMNEGETDVHA